MDKRKFYWETIIFICIVSVIILNIFLAKQSARFLNELHLNVQKSTQVMIAIKDLRYAVLAAESGQRGYILTNNESYLLPYYSAVNELDRRVQAVKKINEDVQYNDFKLSTIIDLVNRKTTELKLTINLFSSSSKQKAMDVIESGVGQQVSISLFALFDKLEDKELTYQKNLYKKIEKSKGDSLLLLFISIFISASLLVGFYILQFRARKKERLYNIDIAKYAKELEEKVIVRTQELTVFSEELKRSNQELEDFAFVASHDLQEPLRKIRTFSDRLITRCSDRLDDKGQDYLQRMNNAATHMSTLIQDLLGFSRIKTRGKPFQQVDLNNIIEVILDDLEVALEKSGGKIVVDDLPVITADASQLHQLFLNVLSNAIKFSRPSTKPHIVIDYSIQNKKIQNINAKYHCIKIADNGIGFDTTYADKIFIPFQRLHAREDYDGTGIGLAICRRIIERHGGHIDVTSEIGEGSSFYLYIPIVAIDITNIERLEP